MALFSRKASMGRSHHIDGKAAANDNAENRGWLLLKMKIFKFRKSCDLSPGANATNPTLVRGSRKRGSGPGTCLTCPAKGAEGARGHRYRPGIPRSTSLYLVWLVWVAADISLPGAADSEDHARKVNQNVPPADTLSASVSFCLLCSGAPPGPVSTLGSRTNRGRQGGSAKCPAPPRPVADRAVPERAAPQTRKWPPPSRVLIGSPAARSAVAGSAGRRARRRAGRQNW